MNAGRLFLGVIFLLGVAVVFKACLEDTQRNTPAPVKYIIRADARVSPDKTGMSVTNTGQESWSQPFFIINGSYQYRYPMNVRSGASVLLPFTNFKNDKEEVFPSWDQFHRFNIQTATMEWNGAS
jgi:hypothetical protein